MDADSPHAVRRREALIAFGGAGIGAVWALTRGPGPGTVAQALAATRASCVVLDPEVTEGPYWIANHLTRRNITEGLPGLPLQLHFTVENASTCKPIPGADVEVWHANAAGAYSLGSKRFLRGHQKADSHGGVVFDTIYPGWYRGRTPHIHLKVHVGGNVVHTGQLFFRDAFTDGVYKRAPYRARGAPDVRNADDSIYAAGGSRSLLRMRTAGKGYVGSISMGVRT
jgi:protocatechuate 3,4-dioxygenase beta subunit